MHIFPLFEVSFVSWVIYGIFVLMWDMPHFSLFSIFILIVNMLFFLLSIGSISRKLDNDKVYFVVSTIWKKTKLVGNIKYESLWNYGFADGFLSGSQIELDGHIKPQANDVISYLLISNSRGQQLILREKIFLDSRFPNECTYRPDFKTDGIDVYDVQRTDKIKKRIGELIVVKSPRSKSRRSSSQ